MKISQLIFLCMVVVVSCQRAYDQHDFYVPTSLTSAWSTVDNYYAPAFYKDFNDLVRLRGVAQKVSGDLPSVIFTLPEGFRPSQTLKIRVVTQAGSSSSTGVINITPTGDVVAVEGAVIFSLDSISFSAPTRKTVLVNGASVNAGLRFPKSNAKCFGFWERFWSPRDPTIYACYDGDSDAEVLLTGTVNPPRPDAPSRSIGILDRPQRPNRDLRIVAPSTQGPVTLNIRTSGDIFIRGYRGGAVFLDGVSFLKNQVSNWREVPQWKNGFSEASGEWFITDYRIQDVFTTPGFRKDSEGRVNLKGIVAPPKPFVTGVVFVLPEGFRPSETVVRAGATAGGYVTVSVNTAGEVTVESITGSQFIDWFSLDGINFVASDVQGQVIDAATTLKFTDADDLSTSVEGSYQFGHSVQLTTPPLRKSGYIGFVSNTPVLVRANLEGAVTAEEFPQVDSDNVLQGNDWKPILFFAQTSVSYESSTERPSLLVDRNNNIVFLRGLFPVTASASFSNTLFSLPSWIKVEKNILVVATGHQSYYPIVITASGEVQWAGAAPSQDLLLLLDGLHFSAVAGSEPTTEHIIV